MTIHLVLQLRRSRHVVVVLWTCLILLSFASCQMSNITTSSDIILTTNMTMVSPSKIFEVGFTNGTQSPNSSTVYAFAIWYAQIVPRTVVWIANRSMALSSEATLTLTLYGDLQVFDYIGGYVQLVWSTNTTNRDVTMVCIRDDGNLLLVNNTDCSVNKSTMVWQSFSIYSNTLLPNQRYRATSRYNAFSIFSWKSDSDWRKGNYSLMWLAANKENLTLSAIWKSPFSFDSGVQEYWRQDHSHHLLFTYGGGLESRDDRPDTAHIILAPPLEAKKSLRLRVTLDQDGNLRMYSWILGTSTTWKTVWTLMPDCNVAGYCGPNVRCLNGNYTCITEKFEFISPTNFWHGCKRTKSKGSDIMVPLGAADYVINDVDVYNRKDNISLNECLQLCLHSRICQMVVTTTTNSTPGLVDSCWLKNSARLNGRNLPLCLAYIRISGSTFPSRIKQIIPSILGVVVMILCLVGCKWFFCSYSITKQRLQKKWKEAKGAVIKFSYREVVFMTKDFANKIGEGGYGTVYKGHIGKTAIAVKQLKKELSSHVEKDFLQEVEIIGTIHHIHLVSLLGYCTNGSHRLLVYEFVEKGTLDKALFQREKMPILDWETRFRMAIEIARGLAYLHDDCKQRIIHCDVKPENILLDKDECVKLADFGLSRIMNHDQTSTMTMNIRGTYGYIAPEWTSIDGTTITTKVDVYSFGMVLLEIISGRHNWMTTDKNFDGLNQYFPAWAFSRLEADSIMDVVDKALLGVVDVDEVRRSLQVAFWCINEQPRLRPSMKEVVEMLQGYIQILIPVQKPAYLDDISSSSVQNSSIVSSNLISSSVDFIQPIESAISPFLSGECFTVSVGR